MKKNKFNILLIGAARHGKDTVAEMINKYFGLTFTSSSSAAAEIFIYDELKDKYGYKTFEECFEDRMNHRKEWHDLICDYNKDDKARLAKDILTKSDMYVGMRSNVEVEECLRQGLFNLVIGVYDPRKPEESKESFDIDMWQKADIIIYNNGTLEDLERKVKKLNLPKVQKLKKVYLAIPYSKMDKEESYRMANEATVKLLNEGYNVFSPITHSHPLGKYNVPGHWEFWQEIDFQFIDWVDEIFVVCPYGDRSLVESSVGVTAELKYAKEKGLPITYINWDVKEEELLVEQKVA